MDDLDRFRKDPNKQLCQWIHSNPEFKKWLSSQNVSNTNVAQPSLLWISAIPGAGKTYLSATIVDILGDTEPVAYFFCDTKDESKRLFLSIVRTWAAQLLEQKPSELEEISKIYRASGVSLNKTNAVKALRHLVKVGSPCRLILDGLDECVSSVRTEVLQLCETLLPDAKLLVASRSEGDIEQAMLKMGRKMTRVHIRKEDNSADIQAYLRMMIKGLQLNNIELEDLITTKLLDGANGMFMWVRLMMEELYRQTTTRQVKKCLENLPTGLHDVYGRVLERIDQSSPQVRSMARRMLQWIACALRPLSVSELVDALAIEIDSDRLDPDDRIINPSRMIANCCGSLIEIEKDKDIVRVAHASVQDFLISSLYTKEPYSALMVDPQDAHCMIARSCITYLSFGSLTYVAAGEDLNAALAKFEQHFKRNGFLEYVSLHWWEHIERAGFDIDLCQTLLRFLRSECHMVHWLQIFHRLRGDNGSRLSSPAVGTVYDILHAFQVFDPKRQYMEIWNFVERLQRPAGNRLLRWQQFMQSTECYWLPIQVAGFFDFVDTVQHELGQGVDVDARDCSGLTALSFAAQGDGVASVKLLLKNGADRDCQTSRYGRTPLMWIVKADFVSPRVVASGEPYRSARVLLEAGANVDLQDEEERRTFLHHLSTAWKETDYEVALVKLVLEYNPRSAGIRDYRGFTPLDLAVRKQSPRIAELLIKHGAPVDFQGYWKRPIHHACTIGNLAVVSVLVAAGADVDCQQPSDGATPLHVAARFRLPDIGDLLLKSGASADCLNHQRRLPLHIAAEEEQMELAKNLIAHGSPLNLKDSSGDTPLDLALRNNFMAMAEILLQAGAVHQALPVTILASSKSTELKGLRAGRDAKPEIYHPDNEHEVLETLFLLHCRTDSKLKRSQLLRIMNLAQYWVKIQVSRDKYWKVAWEDNGPSYMETPPIAGCPTSPVRKIIFKLKSHDQGWSDNIALHGTYAQSYTWFDACVIKAGKSVEEPKNRALQDAIRLQTNVHARKDPTVHTVVWRYDGLDTEDAQSRWVRNLKAGDIIAVVPVAVYPGWVNHVLMVQVEVYSSWV